MICCRFAAFCINLDPFCCVLHKFEPVLLRSTLIWTRFAAFCIDFGVILLRSALICVFSMRSALIWGRFTAFCIDLESFCAVQQRLFAHSPENELNV